MARPLPAAGIVSHLAIALVTLAVAGCTGAPRGPFLADSATPAEAGPPVGRSGNLTHMADNAFRTGESAMAASLYEEALMVDGRNVPAALGLGNALLALGRPQDASRAFERALSVDEGSAAAHYGYARAMMALRRPEVAVEHLEAALKRRPDDPQALNALGVAHDLMGRHDLAVAAYQRGLAASPNTPALRNNLGLSLALAGRYEEAVAQLRPLAEGPEAGRRTRQNLALAYALKGDLAAAQRLGRVDLSESQLRDNLTYLAAVRGIGDSRLKAAAIAPVASVQQQRELPRLAAAEPTGLLELAAPQAGGAPAPVLPAAAPAVPPLPAPAKAQAPKSPRPLGRVEPQAGPGAGRWFVKLGEYPSGAVAADRWRQLQQDHPKTLGGLNRLAEVDEGPAALLVGPVASQKAAMKVCTRMPADFPSCTPIRL